MFSIVIWKSVKKLGFGILNFAYKMFGQVFIHNTIAGSEKCQHVGYKMPLSVIEIKPVFHILTQSISSAVQKLASACL
jgi:hypothetical protein